MADYEHHDSDSNNVSEEAPGDSSRAVEQLDDDDDDPRRRRSSKSGSKGRKSSHKRTSGSGDRRQSKRSQTQSGNSPKRSPKRSSSRSTHRTSQSKDIPPEFVDLIHKVEGDKKRAKVSPRRSKQSINPKSFGSEERSKRSTGNTTSKIDTKLRTEVLYGDDAEAKKRSSGGTKRANRAGAERVSESGQTRTTRSTELLLYGDAQAKAKAKSVQKESNHSKTSHSSKSSATETLYGDDDAKKRARVRQSNSSSNRHPGVERVMETESDDSSRSSFTSVASRSQTMDGSIVTGIVVEDSSSYHHSLQGQENSTNDDSNSLQEQTNNDADLPVREGRTKKKRKSQQEKQWEKKYFRYFVLAAILIVLVGGGIMAFIVLSRGSDDSPETQVAGGNLQDPTVTNPKPPPTKQNIFDHQPSREDCAAIRNNQTIPGQDSLPQRNFNLNVQVNIKGNTTMSDEMVQGLMDSIQAHFVTSLAGCNNTDDGQRKLIWGMRGSNTRKLGIGMDESRFAILYAYAMGQVQADAVCADTLLPGVCYMLMVELSLYLDGDITSSELESIINEEFGSGSNVVSKLNLGDTFLSVTVTNITNVTPPSDAPSTSPTDVPSVSPSASPSKAPIDTSPTSGPPSSSPSKAPIDTSPTLLPAPTPFTAAPTVGPVAGPKPISNQLPTSIPTDLPSTSPSVSPSMAQSSSPISSPALKPVVGLSPPPTVAPTLSASITPSTKPTEASATPTVQDSATPTVQESDTPSTVPSIVSSSFPSMSSSAPSSVPSRAPSSYASPVPSPVPSKSPSRNPTPGPTTQCYCMSSWFCDATVTTATFSMGCRACAGIQSCVNLSSGLLPGQMPVIGEDACQQYHACRRATVAAIGANSCVGSNSCNNRIVSAQTNSCHGNYACAASSSNTDGKLQIGGSTCLGQYSCYSYTIRAEQSSCQGDWACGKRSKIYAADGACIGRNACMGAVSNAGDDDSEDDDDGSPSSGVLDQVQTEPSYFGKNSCTCENCCVCMVRVVSNRCTSLGECCDEDDPTEKVASDNTEAEMKADLGVSDLLSVFPV